MLDTPVDGWYSYIGAALAGVGLLAVALGLPAAPPPAAEDVGAAVDATATSDYDAATTVALDAEFIRLTPRGVAVRGPGGTARTPFQYGPVTPVYGEPLRAVLNGTAPSSAFESPTGFRAAAREARARAPEWRPAPRTLRVRHVGRCRCHARRIGG